MTGVAVLIVAAGRGERAGGTVPKQYASLLGKESSIRVQYVEGSSAFGHCTSDDAKPLSILFPFPHIGVIARPKARTPR